VTPVDARAALLCAECRRDWAAVKTHLARARGADPTRGAPEAALVALSLDHAYQAFETILVRLERGAGLPERIGSSWHVALLADAALPVPGLRPALFSREGLAEWDALLRFRHFLRHAYVIDLDADKLVVNVGRLERAVEATDAWLEDVVAGLLGD
jgi:hypothetical protein